MRAASGGKEGSGAIYWLLASMRAAIRGKEGSGGERAIERRQRKEAARRSPTMAGAELMAAVERVRPLPDPCVRASKEGRGRGGDRGAIYSRE